MTKSRSIEGRVGVNPAFFMLIGCLIPALDDAFKLIIGEDDFDPKPSITKVSTLNAISRLFQEIKRVDKKQFVLFYFTGRHNI